ncbi:MAG: class I SAM-dependent methyltransferase [Neorhizobium sp.]|nr:class I SAM-dependent methyltransferase [Neorhizobium sp.]
MPSNFNVSSAEGYERLMGRWSKRLAPLFLDFSGLADGERILDVGCGNGSLTFAVPKVADIAEIVAVDYEPVFVEAVRSLISDPRITACQADAAALPFDNGRFDRAMALLVLHFVPDAAKAVAEMRRVVRPDGMVAAAVWDHPGGMPAMRMLLDTAAMLDEDARAFRKRYCCQPMTAPGDLAKEFAAAGLVAVEEASLSIRMEFSGFADYWASFSTGEGPIGRYVAGAEPALAERLKQAVSDAYRAGRDDGPRSFAAVAWACRGRVPR